MPSCPWSRLSAGPTGCPLQTPWRRGPTCLQWATGVAKQLPRRRATSPAPRAPAPLPLAPLRAHARRPRRAPSSARRCLRRRWHTVARPTFSIQTSIGANFQHSNLLPHSPACYGTTQRQMQLIFKRSFLNLSLSHNQQWRRPSCPQRSYARIPHTTSLFPSRPHVAIVSSMPHGRSHHSRALHSPTHPPPV